MSKYRRCTSCGDGKQQTLVNQDGTPYPVQGDTTVVPDYGPHPDIAPVVINSADELSGPLVQNGVRVEQIGPNEFEVGLCLSPANPPQGFAIDPITGCLVDTGLAGGGGCCNQTVTLNQSVGGDGETLLSVTVNDDNGPVTSNQVAVQAACTVSGANGWTGTQTGVFVDGCETLTITDPTVANYVEVEYPAAGFPLRTRQIFVNGVSGREEYWVTLLDVNSVAQWHQVA